MQDINTIKFTFIQLFKPILSKNFFQRLKELNADKYVKKLKTTQLIGLLPQLKLCSKEAYGILVTVSIMMSLARQLI